MNPILPINIDALLHQRSIEGERVEYKAGWNPEGILHTLCAFANDFHNLGGGYLVIGVEEKGGLPVLPPKGIDTGSIDTVQKELLNLGYGAMQPQYHPIAASYLIKGRTILVLWAPGGETRPYKAKVRLAKDSTEWGYFIRKGSSTISARGADERELLGLAATVPFDDRFNQSASIDDLSPHLMQEFLREVGSGLADTATTLSSEALGCRMNIVGGSKEAHFPKNVGLLFRSIRMEDLRAGRAVSRRYRNRRIGEFLKELDLTEGRSTGIPKILKAMKSNGSPSPEFDSDEDRGYFLIRLLAHERAAREPVPREEEYVTPQVTPQVPPQVISLISAMQGEMLREDLQQRLGVSDRKYFSASFIRPAMEAGLIEMTVPDKPRSSIQSYRLTDKGRLVMTELERDR